MLSSFADVKRYGMIEQLSNDPAAWDLSRVALGQVKLLDSHSQNSVGAVLGTLIDARFENGLLVGTVQLGESDAARAAEPDILSGHLKGVSIGYRVDQWSLVSSGDVDTWRADKITLMEASLVSVPADAGAMIRSADEDDAAPAAREWSYRDAARMLERAEFFGQRDIAERLIHAGRDEEAIMRAVRQAAQDAGPSLEHSIGGPRASLTSRGGFMHNETSTENPKFRRQVAGDALYAAITRTDPPNEAARQLLGGASLHDIERFIDTGDTRRGWSPREAGEGFVRAHSTSDFPNILGSALHKIAINQMRINDTGASAIVGKPVPVLDFRNNKAVSPGSFPAMKEVKEAGEIQGGTIGDAGEDYIIKSYASRIDLTYQAFRNDDSGALMASVRNIAFAAVDLRSNTILASLGTTMSDGATLFHANHGNLSASGAALSVSSLGEARKAMRDQKALNSTSPLNITPEILLVGTGNETLAEQLVADITAAQVDQVNPFSKKLMIAVEPRLTGTAWYLFASPGAYETIRFASLDGAEAPKVEFQDSFDRLVMSWRVVWHIGAAPIDYRGAYKNLGA